MIRDKLRLALSQPLHRRAYAFWGISLFVVKYNVDRAVSIFGFDRPWYVTDYFAYLGDSVADSDSSNDTQLAWALVVTALPFIVIGTWLTLRRLIDAGLPGWMVGVFFVPLINLPFFGMLCLLPAKEMGQTGEGHRRKWLDRLIPYSETGSAMLALGATAVLGTGAAWFSITVLGEYGWSLFLGIPFMQGLASALLFGYHQPQSLSKSVGVAMLSLALLAAIVLASAIEGLLCLAMALPLAVPMIALGAFLGHQIQKSNRKGLPAAILMFGLLPLLSGAERQGNRQARLIPVTTQVVIDRSKQEVWDQLVTFNNIEEPREWILRFGIAYPVKAVIEGTGVGSIRRCRFTTGDFVEPITVWDEPHLLQFSVQDMPPPMVEWSFYDDLQLPHLEGYFVSEKGEFRLTSLSSGKTLLQGTTWYRHNIWPRAYWRIWSDHILHSIHRRVLHHIKARAEATCVTGNR